MNVSIKRPHLTMPEAEADWLRTAYADAAVILEYGSGGSTVMGAEMSGKTIFSVESDKVWRDGMRAWFDATPSASPVYLHHADVGPTGEWGMPIDEKKWRKWHQYPLSVWDRTDFVPPDVVLIDGRFRAGCYLAVLFRTAKPLTVYFDDYRDRSNYHVIERYGKPVEMRGRMARFDIEPMAIPVADLDWIIATMTKKH
jgi:hypothetical protein